MSSRKSSERNIKQHVRAYVGAEEKAHYIVEKLALEDAVKEEEVNDIINCVTPEHYADIVEERAVSGQCGYLLCSKRLEKVSKQKYHISLKSKLVYDMTERKCFCSSFCFKASKWLERQVPSTPLLNREERINVDLLKATDRSLVKSISPREKDIIIGASLLTDEDEETSETDMVGKSTVDKSKVCTGVTQRDSASSVQFVKDAMLEWCTIETVNFIRWRKQHDSSGSTREAGIDLSKKGSDIRKAYPHETDASEAVDDLSSGMNAKLQIHERKTTSVGDCKVLPPLDNKAQVFIRRKIVSDRLRRSFGKVLKSFGLQLSDISSDLAGIIKSLSFSSRNILLSLIEWRLTTLVILQLMATFSPVVQKALEESKEALNGLLMALNTDIGAVNDIVESLLSKHETSPEDDIAKEFEELD